MEPSDADRSIEQARRVRERTEAGLRRTEDLLRQVDEVHQAIEAHQARRRGRGWFRRAASDDEQKPD